jgi:serine/threonine protein phosphatase PrpC
VRAATVAGVRHRLAGRECEDAFAWAAGSWGAVLAVADGVSATVDAGPAAMVAVDEACAAGAALLDAPEGKGAAVAAGHAVGAANRAVAEGRDAGRLGATTLVVAVVAPDGSWALARVGDSSAFVLGEGGWSEAFGSPDGDDDAPVTTATAALPAATPVVETASGVLGPGDALILVTDGVAGPLRDGPETVAPTLAAGLGRPPTPLTLAALTDFSRQGCHDDRTVLGVWLAGPGTAVP